MNKDLLTEDKKTYRFEFVEPNQRSIIYRVIGDKENDLNSGDVSFN